MCKIYINNDMQNNKENKIKNKLSVLKESALLKGIVVGLLIAVVFFSGYFTHYLSINKELRSIEFLLDVYKKHYYKESERDVVHALADQILDIYSGYYTAEEYQAYLKEGQGSKSGYGIALLNLEVYKVAGNSPAELAGIKPNGTVIGYKKSSESEFVKPNTQKALTDFLSQTNEEINLKIDYSGVEEIFILQRAEYLENYVYYSDSTGSYRFNGDQNGMIFTKYGDSQFNLDSGLGYIKFTSFNGLKKGTLGGAGQFKGALDAFKNNGNTKLIIDLRGNGGGYMSILCDIASYLCDDKSGQTFVSQKARYRNGQIDNFNSALSAYSQYGFESIIFLADRGSASASEALMGAVLDYDAKSENNIVKVIVEPTVENDKTIYATYGKGIMQSMYTNSLTGEAVKLTTAEVVWPISGTCIHGVGLNPELDDRIYANTFGDAVEYAKILAN